MKQWSKNFEKCSNAVADPGGGGGGGGDGGPCSPLFLNQTEARRAEKNVF